MGKCMLNYRGTLSVQKIIITAHWGLKAYKKNNEKVEDK